MANLFAREVSEYITLMMYYAELLVVEGTISIEEQMDVVLAAVQQWLVAGSSRAPTPCYSARQVALIGSRTCFLVSIGPTTSVRAPIGL